MKVSSPPAVSARCSVEMPAMLPSIHRGWLLPQRAAARAAAVDGGNGHHTRARRRLLAGDDRAAGAVRRRSRSRWST